jgi:signal transduction histidine kinase
MSFKIRNIAFFLLPCFLLTNNLFAQKSKTDSLQDLLSKETIDSNKVILMWKLADVVSNYNPDSAVVLSRQALLLASSIKYVEGESRSLGVMANTFIKQGNYPRALEYQLKKLQIEEKRNNPRNLASVLMNIGVAYIYQEEYRKSLEYYSKSDGVINAYKLGDLTYYSALNLGDVYDRLNVSDSAFIYFTKALTIAKQLKDDDLIGTAMTGLGHTFLKTANFPKAHANYQAAIVYLKAANDDEILCEALLGIAKLLKKTNQPDSAVYYARLSQNLAKADGFLKMNLQAAGFLADYYKKQKNIDSAFAYINEVQAVNDSINSKARITEAQIITSNEQLRQLETEENKKTARRERKQQMQQLYIGLLITGLTIFILIASLLYRNNRHKQHLNKTLEKTLADLKSTQAQLIQSAKMASLGELTAGIAHEIQNPLNFVNNFSELNIELIAEMTEEIEQGNMEEVKAIAIDLAGNEQKINHHGKRADSIVKGMLQHSRSTGSTVKESTNINALADEYLKLAYHGLRAKDKSFNATLKTNFDEGIGNISILPQDIGRVILNLITNAFYAITDKKKTTQVLMDGQLYEPTVVLSTKKIGAIVEIKVSDNGTGIPQKLMDKIFQPFFTTKPTGEGTGLGLSLCYDIIKAHGGDLKVENNEGDGAAFVIHLPLK